MTHSCSILVVEDNSLTRKMVRVALQKRGYVVVDAGDGAMALALLEEHRPSMVILDLHLPDMDGMTLARLIRKHPAGQRIPLIAFSGLLSRIDEVRASGAGFTDYLFKPVEPSRLVTLVDFYLSTQLSHGISPGAGRCVLLVDDDPLQAQQDATQLRAFGFTVEVAGDPHQTAAAARASRPDAIVLDLLMPGMTGLELCLALRREPTLHDIPIVIASATFQVLDAGERQLASEIGADAFVDRTPSLVEVAQALNNVIGQPRTGGVNVRAEQLSSEFISRLMRQLEHQASLNLSLVRQAATQTALLSIMAGTAQILSESHDLTTLLHEVLTRALDAGGVSAGAIYLLDERWQPVLRSQIGFPEALSGELAASFGHPDLFSELAMREGPTEIPSNGVDPSLASGLLARARSTSLVLAPLLAAGRSHGALLLQASAQDLGAGFLTSIAAVAGELGQAVALSRSVEQLAASEARYRMLFQGVPTGVFRSALNGTLIDVNDELVRLLGASSAAELLGTSALARYAHPADRLVWQQEVDRHGSVTDFETRLRKLNDEVLWVSLSARGIRGPDSEVLSYEGAVTDITRRKEAEAALQAAQSRLSLVLASTDTVIYFLRWTAEGPRPFWITENVLRVTGHELGSALRPEWWLDNVHPEDRERALAVMATLPETGEATQQYRFRRADGAYMWMRDSHRLLRDEHGAPEGVAGAWVDITEQKSLEEQLRQAQKMEAIGQLAAGVAHDFNNILTVIAGHAGLLAEDVADSLHGAASVHEIAQAAKRAGLLTRQLLTFGRQQLVQPEVFDVNTAVSDAARMCERLIGKHIAVQTLLSSHPLRVRLDPGHLEQVILNLAVNARDAMERGGRLTIRTRQVTLSDVDAVAVSVSHGGAFAALQVSDTGTGIAPDVLPRIFEPFFTTKEHGRGTGLGLATVYGIVKQSGGGVSVDSSADSGTTFSIYFPLTQEAERGVGLGTSLVSAKPAHGENILLVEDEEAVRRFAAAVLVRHGYRVIETRLPEEALRFAEDQSHLIDLLLTDVIMPGLTGPELNQRIQVIRPGLPVIFTSGYPCGAMADHRVPANANATLEKPFTANQLLETVGLCLADRRPLS